MKYKSLILIALAYSTVYLFINNYKSDVAQFNQTNAARRQVAYICDMLEDEEVSRQDLCSKPVPTVPGLVSHYERLRQQDEAWYRQHGWLYYPIVSCQDNDIKFRIMDKNFTCS